MDNETLVRTWIRDFVMTYHEDHDVETRWQEPVVGFSSAEDPLYEELKKIIDPAHALPTELLPGARSVIAWYVPFVESIALTNIPGEESSREWDYAYIETNRMIEELSDFLCRRLEESGFQASHLPPTYNYDAVRLFSTWSHRSAACISGVGKFGLNNMLITEKGCCGRVGSVITDMPLTPTPRAKGEFCLFKRDGSCGQCMGRCPNNAYAMRDGVVEYDRYKCNEQIYGKIIPQWPIGPGDTCGKCMCDVPCSFRIP